MRRTPRLECWGVRRYHSGPRAVWLAPESNPNCLVGKIYDHPRHPDGKWIKTSPFVGAKGRLVYTENGSTYELGEPDPSYLTWLADHGEQYNPEAPIRARKSK